MRKAKTQLDFISTQEAADRLGCCQAHVRRLVLTGRVIGFKFSGTAVAVSIASLKAYEKTKSPRGRSRKNKLATS